MSTEKTVKSLRNEMNALISELSLDMTTSSMFEELLKEMATQMNMQPSDIKLVREGEDVYIGCVDPESQQRKIKPAIDVVKDGSLSTTTSGSAGFGATEEAKKEAERMNRELGVE